MYVITPRWYIAISQFEESVAERLLLCFYSNASIQSRFLSEFAKKPQVDRNERERREAGGVSPAGSRIEGSRCDKARRRIGPTLKGRLKGCRRFVHIRQQN